MTASVKRATGIPYGILSGMVVTAALFVTLPLLTQFQKEPSGSHGVKSVFIKTQKPAPPPSEERDRPEKQSLIEKEFLEKDVRPKQMRPNYDIPKANPLNGAMDGIKIAVVPAIETVAPISNPTYRPEEVDQQPALFRSFSPPYPYLAQRDNIEGWVILWFVVGADGNTSKAEVVAAEPEGVFEEAALKAVKHYKFKPAIKNGETVSCAMKQRIVFNLD